MISQLRQKLKKSASLKVSALIMSSRVLGLLRDVLYARVMGVGWQSDAFFIACRIPNMLRDLLGEGALSPAVTSRLGAVGHQHGVDRLRMLVRRLYRFFFLSFVVISLVGIVSAPLLVMVIAPGFAEDPEKRELTVQLTRIIFPYIGLVGMSALTMGVLHHCRVFAWSSSASSFFNLTIISCALLTLQYVPAGSTKAVHFVAWGVVLGGVVQWLIQGFGFRGTGLSFLPAGGGDPEIKVILRKMAQATAGVAAVQINVAVNTAYASYLDEGAVTCLYYAFRVMQLPVGIVGVAVSMVILPDLAKFYHEKNEKDFVGRLTRALAKVSDFTLPAMLGLLVLQSLPIEVLYGSKEFGSGEVHRTWLALAGYIPGIFTYAWNKNLTQAYYAREDMKFPARVSMISIFVNALLNGYLAFGLGWGILGLTLGTSFVLMSNTLLLILGLKFRHDCDLLKAGLLKRPLPALLASALMAVGMYALLLLMRETVTSPELRLIALAAFGAVLYFVFAGLLGRFFKKGTFGVE